MYPGGHVEPNETPIETLKREFEEETGLAVEPLGLLHRIKDEYVAERPLHLLVLEEVVRYPDSMYIHFDLVHLVHRVGGALREGVWIDVDRINEVETHPNVRKVIRLASDVIYRPSNV